MQHSTAARKQPRAANLQNDERNAGLYAGAPCAVAAAIHLEFC